MIRVCSGNNAATAGTNCLLGVATKFDKSLENTVLLYFQRG
jgi:hypothetical protein